MIFNASLSVAPLEVLVQLVQIGGIGGTLAFLLLGYYLLWKEQDKKDAQGNPVPPNQLTIDAIYRFLKYALVFFFVGIAAQVAMMFTQDTLRRWNQPAMSQLLFDRWFYDPGQNRVIVSFSQIDFADVPVIAKSKRGEHDVYVGIRTKQTTKPTVGEYPVLLGHSTSHRPRTKKKLSRPIRSPDWALACSLCFLAWQKTVRRSRSHLSRLLCRPSPWFSIPRARVTS